MTWGGSTSTVPEHNRRKLKPTWQLLSAAVVGFLVTVAVACAPPKSSETGASGGALNYGIIGNKNDKEYPYLPTLSSSQTMKNYQIFDTLTDHTRHGKLKMALAKKMTPKNNYKDWDVTLRKGVKFSDGKPLRPEDVVYSFKQIFRKDHPSSAKSLLTMMNPDQVTVKSPRIVHFKLKRSFSTLPELLSYEDIVIVSKKSTYEHPVGTGPFKVTSFKADSQATLKRNPHYWGKKPGFETLKITYFKEHDAVLNALQSGQIDMAHSVQYPQIAQAKSAGKRVLTSDSASYPMLEMRTDIKPFNDKRVRRAFQLMVDRKRVIENAYSGYASRGNDYTAEGDECGIPGVKQRHQDIKKAKKLLADAGHSHLKTELATDGASAGMKESAEVFAQGAQKAGVKVKVRKLSTADFLDKWGSWPFYISISDPPYVVGAIDHFSAKGVDNSTHFKNKKYTKLLSQLTTTGGQKKQCSIIKKMHKNVYNHGGEIIPAIPKKATAFDSSVHGIKGDKLGRAAYMFGGVTVG